MPFFETISSKIKTLFPSGSSTPTEATPSSPIPATDPLWLHYAREEMAKGVKEVSGDVDNPIIVGYWKESKVPFLVKDDETPWCAAFVNAMIERSGIEGTRNGLAVSFASSKNFIKLQRPVRGCIAVYWRISPKSGKGHVHIAVAETPTRIIGIGGNQGDSVSEAPFPKSKLLGFYWPKSVPIPNKPLAFRSVAGQDVSDS